MSSGKIVAIIQARMKSSRLPGKVLLEIGGQPVLKWVIERLSRAKTVSQIMVATTTDPTDDAVADFCRQIGIVYVRGDMNDVLDRFYQAALHVSADIIVRVTGDCPIIDPALVDETVQAFQGLDAAVGPFDFAANRLPPPFRRTYPIGLDNEVCTFSALERAWKEADRPFHREHVMPYFYEGIQNPERIKRSRIPGWLDLFVSPRGFKVLLLNHDCDYGDLRWTLDTSADLDLLKQIVKRLNYRRDFTWQEVLNVVLNEPDLRVMNVGTNQKDFRESEQAR